MNKAIIIFSGGQDSTTCLYWAKKNFDHVEAITFNYGQQHFSELVAAKKICEVTNTKHTVIDTSFLKTIVDSSLTGGTGENGKGLPSTFVPNRNQLFITIAHAYAQKIGATNLVTGVCETDFSGYPDCRQGFIDLIARASNMGSDSEILIHTPLMFLDKSQIWKLANDLGCLREVIELSHTCYQNEHGIYHGWGYGCGTCDACELRKKGYNKFVSLQ